MRSVSNTDWEAFTNLPITRETNCYRITAYEQNGNQTFSYSNEACITGQPVLIVANAFSPNGDGINDEFLISQLFTERYHIQIFDRWGKVVFVSTDPSVHWNGHIRSQGPAPEGVYTYVIEGLTLQQKEFSQSGTITLIR